VTRSSPGRTWAVVLGVLGLGNGAVWGGAFLFFRPVPPSAAAPVPAVAPSPLVPEEDAGGLLPVFASSDGVALRLVSAEAVAVAFHEASYDDATALRPTGVCRVCRNRTKFDPPDPKDPGLAYIVTDIHEVGPRQVLASCWSSPPSRERSRFGATERSRKHPFGRWGPRTELRTGLLIHELGRRRPCQTASSPGQETSTSRRTWKDRARSFRATATVAILVPRRLATR